MAVTAVITIQRIPTLNMAIIKYDDHLDYVVGRQLSTAYRSRFVNAERRDVDATSIASLTGSNIIGAYEVIFS